MRADFVTEGDRQPGSFCSQLVLSHHVLLWRLGSLLFPVSWEFFESSQYRIGDRCVRSLHFPDVVQFSLRFMLSPFLAFSVVLGCCFCVVSLPG